MQEIEDCGHMRYNNVPPRGVQLRCRSVGVLRCAVPVSLPFGGEMRSATCVRVMYRAFLTKGISMVVSYGVNYLKCTASKWINTGKRAVKRYVM